MTRGGSRERSHRYTWRDRLNQARATAVHCISTAEGPRAAEEGAGREPYEGAAQQRPSEAQGATDRKIDRPSPQPEGEKTCPWHRGRDHRAAATAQEKPERPYTSGEAEDAQTCQGVEGPQAATMLA